MNKAAINIKITTPLTPLKRFQERTVHHLTRKQGTDNYQSKNLTTLGHRSILQHIQNKTSGCEALNSKFKWGLFRKIGKDALMHQESNFNFNHRKFQLRCMGLNPKSELGLFGDWVGHIWLIIMRPKPNSNISQFQQKTWVIFLISLWVRVELFGDQEGYI